VTEHELASWVPPAKSPERRAGRIVFWVLFGLAGVVLAASVVTLIVISRVVYPVTTPTMENTVLPGDHLLLAPGSGLRRGDVVVLQVPVQASGTTGVFVKRVIGLPGDHVACCNAKGQVTVDGKALDETYLYPGDRPSEAAFSARVGPGQIWVMGDRRNISVDSRKWGPVPLSGVVGRVQLVERNFKFTTLRTPQAFTAAGLAPTDTRPDYYAVLALAAAGAVAALVVLAVFGITRFAFRQRRTPQRPRPPLPSPGIAPGGAGFGGEGTGSTRRPSADV